MNNGPSRELLELWAPDPRNGLIVTGYSVEGTMARVSQYRQDPLVIRRVPIRPCCMYNAKQWTSFSFVPPRLRGLSACESELMFMHFPSSALGYPRRARRDHWCKGQHHPEKDLGRLHLLQRTCRLLAKLGGHGARQATTHREFTVPQRHTSQ